MDPTMKKSRIENQVTGPFDRDNGVQVSDDAPTTRQSVIENRVEEISDAEEDYGTDEGVRVTAEQQDDIVSTNQQRVPIDPVTGQALPPIIDPLTGRIVHAKIDRESTVRAILDEEEQLEDEYEEIIEEEIVAHQTAEDLAMQEQEEPMMPLVRHTRMPDQDTRSKVANILNRNKSNLQTNMAMTQFKHDRQFGHQGEPSNGQEQQRTPFSQYNGGLHSYNQANVPPGFFEAQVDNPIEDRMRSQFGLPPNNLPKQRYQPGFGSHREGFNDDVQRFDQQRNQQFGIHHQQQMPSVVYPKEEVPTDELTPEQRAVFSKFSNQPHRFGMEPNLPEQVAAKRQADIAQYAAEQRNQLNQLANGVMPKVFNSHRVEPATLDDQGFDPVDTPHASTKVPVIVNSTENSIVEMLRKGIREDIRSCVRDEIREEMTAWQRHPSSTPTPQQPLPIMMPQQYHQCTQQQYCLMPTQQQMMMQPQQMMMPMFANSPPTMSMPSMNMMSPQVVSQPIVVQPIVMHQPPVFQQYPFGGGMGMMNPYQNFGGQRFF